MYEAGGAKSPEPAEFHPRTLEPTDSAERPCGSCELPAQENAGRTTYGRAKSVLRHASQEKSYRSVSVCSS